jgi:F0F1-type ATP synthase epsilon subunit
MKYLTVSISSPSHFIWQGNADAVSSINTKGPFDILPEHTNFITIIENKPIIIRSGKEKKDFLFERAVIYTYSNYVSIYAI